MTSDLVSIIMLCHNGEEYVEETIRSVLAQTYQNWELLFVDDNSKDNTLSVLMELMHVDKEAQRKTDNPNVKGHTYGQSRISISHTTWKRGESPLRNQALKEANGRWIAFLDVGDVWEPTKLERQISFMEQNGYAFSYTKYGLMDVRSEDRGVVIGGKQHVTYKDIKKCCWPAYLTVMYDANAVGRIHSTNLKSNNDYALWLNVSKKVDCYLLDEYLAKMRTSWGIMGRLLLTNRIKWRYEVYRVEMGKNPLVSGLMTLRNLFYGLVKWGGVCFTK